MLVHVVMFRFKTEVDQETRATVIAAAKEMKHLDSVMGHKLLVGSPSVTNPLTMSQGYDFALVSYHNDLEALTAYQKSPRHQHLVSSYLKPNLDDLVRFDFEVDKEDEHMIV